MKKRSFSVLVVGVVTANILCVEVRADDQIICKQSRGSIVASFDSTANKAVLNEVDLNGKTLDETACSVYSILDKSDTLKNVDVSGVISTNNISSSLVGSSSIATCGEGMGILKINDLSGIPIHVFLLVNWSGWMTCLP